MHGEAGHSPRVLYAALSHVVYLGPDRSLDGCLTTPTKASGTRPGLSVLYQHHDLDYQSHVGGDTAGPRQPAVPLGHENTHIRYYMCWITHSRTVKKELS